MTFQGLLNRAKSVLLPIVKWCVISVLMGVVGGLIGTAFHYALQFVTGVRQSNAWLIFLLPVGGLLIIELYRLFRLGSNRGTDEVIDSIREDKPLSPLIAPAVFIGAAVTHLFGGSAGREGAALQLGSSAATLFYKLFRLQEKERSAIAICGAAAVFSGLFRMPLTAGLFTVEFASVGTIFSSALLPCFVAALAANAVSALLGVDTVTVMQDTALPLSFNTTWRVVVLATLIAFLGWIMCHVFHKSKHLASRFVKSQHLRIVIGAVVIIVLTLLVGDQRFNGAGMEMAVEAMNGTADWYSFLLKLLFTAVTLAVGFKGGEIVPTFCIGATFGCIAGDLLGLDPAFAATLGLVGLFCAATNSPLASIVLSVEMFGSANLPIYALTCVIAFALSGNSGLYHNQVIEFPKIFTKRNSE